MHIRQLFLAGLLMSLAATGAQGACKERRNRDASFIELAVPEIGATIDRQFLTGIGTLDERMLILLDIERLMASSEMGLVIAKAA